MAGTKFPYPPVASPGCPDRARGEATSIAVLSLWAAYFVLVFTFPMLFERLKDRSFYIYAAVRAVGFLFIWRRVKETKGRTLEELEELMVGDRGNKR